MTFIEAAAEVLRHAGKPLHYKEITELAIGQNLLSHVGKTPEITMSHRLTAAIKKDDKEIPIVKVKPGVFALREWSAKKGRKGAAAAAEDTSEEAEVEGGGEDAGVEVNALEIEAAMRTARDAEARADDDDADGESPAEPVTPVSGEEALRADLAASGADFFDDEDDDDEPILASAQQTEAGAAPAGEGGRRRRRRRRRGRGGSAGEGAGEPRPASQARADGSQPRLDGGAIVQPTPIVSVEADGSIDARDPLAVSRPVVRDRQQIMAGGQPTGIDIAIPEGDDLTGRELADAAALVLGTFDRNAGPAAVRAVAEVLARRGRLQGDPAMATAQVSASMRADNLRRGASGQRPRFRFAAGGRVASTDWSLGGELPRLEQEVNAAIERYRDAARRAMLRKMQELPGHALIELLLLLLERTGMSNLRPVRRAGSPGGEAHFAAIHKAGGDAIPLAIVIRKDGREIGRERVTDLRGALHHYGPATAGWLLTMGQCLSGAREEANVPGAPPVALYDGIAICKLLEDLDVGVIKTRVTVCIPDLELLESLRG